MANFSLHSFPQIQNEFVFVKVLLDFDCSSKYALCANIENADQSHNTSDEANFDNTMAWMDSYADGIVLQTQFLYGGNLLSAAGHVSTM